MADVKQVCSCCNSEEIRNTQSWDEVTQSWGDVGSYCPCCGNWDRGIDEIPVKEDTHGS